MAKTTKKGQKFISKEISQLMKKGPSKGPLKGQRFTQKRAIAAAISVAKKKGYKTAASRDENTSSIFDDLLIESEGSGIFDELLVSEVEENKKLDAERLARALLLSEDLVRIHAKIVGK